MPLPTAPVSRINRQSWWLWCVTFAVILALAITVPMLYARLLDLTPGDEAWIVKGEHVWLGVGGLVVVFCLYTALRQRELERVRERLQLEAGDLDDMKHRLSEVSELFGVSTTLNLQLRLDVILEIIVRRVVSTMRGQQASIMIYDAETGMLRTRASYGLDPAGQNAERRIGEGIAGWVAQQQQAVLLGPQESDQALRSHYKAERNISSALSLPLRVGDRCVGVLNVNRLSAQVEPFQEHHRETLRLFAEHVGSVIDRAVMLERVSARAQALESTHHELSDLRLRSERFVERLAEALEVPLAAIEGAPESAALAPHTGEARRTLAAALEVARQEIREPEIETEAEAIDGLVRSAVERARPQARARRVEIEVEITPATPGAAVDPVSFAAALSTIIERAVLRSTAGTRVGVHLGARDDGARIEIADRGPAQARDRALAAFDVFAGTGSLGAETTGVFRLHLARRIIERLRGRLDAHRDGDLNVISIQLPAPVVEERAQAA